MTHGSPAFHPHDHAACAGSALQRAQEIARRKGLRLTPVRLRVLEILTESHRALGAYDVLERLRADGLGSQPPVAYRALDFLVQHGLAHRIDHLNAFAACMAPGETHAPVFLVCDACGALAELAGTQTAAALRAEAAAQGFRPRRMAIEAAGLCPACAGEDTHAVD